MFKLIGVAALVSAALVSGQAMAVTGGGSTLPAALYTGAANSILPANFSYLGTGSGIGKTAFLTNNPVGFSTTGTVHFAASESILSSAELNAYTSNYGAAYGPLIQLPSVSTSVVIAYKKSGQTALNLTSAQLCDALSGSKTTWGALLGSSDPTPIRVLYRDVSSGTSELLTRHLNSICPTQFATNATFTSARLPVGSSIPSNWVAVRNTLDVVPAVNAVDGSIGYSGPDGIAVTNNAVVARINGVLPTLANVSLAVSSAALPATPANPAQWVPVVANPASGYAISGYSNLLFGQCYRDAAVANDVRAFLAKHYSVPGNAVATVAHGLLPIPTRWKNAVTANFITNTSGNNLDINNPSVCNGIGRPL